MKAHYGYTDGSGSYYIILDTDRCNGCGKCVEACPQGVFGLVDDEFEEDVRVATVQDEHRRKLKYSCSSCKPTHGAPPLPCVVACEPAAIAHAW